MLIRKCSRENKIPRKESMSLSKQQLHCFVDYVYNQIIKLLVSCRAVQVVLGSNVVLRT